MCKDIRFTARLALTLIVVMAFHAAFAQAKVPGRVLVKFTPSATTQAIATALTQEGATSVRELPKLGVKVLAVAPGAETRVAKALSRRPGVVFAEPDWAKAPAVIPNDPYWMYQWHLPKMSVQDAWGINAGLNSVTIAILDTGCDPTHPDLVGKYVPGWNTYSNNANTTDVYGHGTPVAGCAAASTNNGFGVAGVAWNCRIMPMKVSDASGYGYSSTIANALTWAADRGARVANISYIMTGDATVRTAAQYFQSRGGVVTISSGNGGTFDSTPDNPYALTVAATNYNDVRATWSNSGNAVDIAAPGETIYSTNNGGTYGSWSGTSFSAPVAAGVVALAISANPTLTGTQIQTVLKQSADDKGVAGWDTLYGWGRVNALRAVNLALATSGSADTTAPNASFIYPTNAAITAGTISVQVNATDDVGVASVTLYLDGVALGTDTTAPFTFAWNTTTSTNGTHNLRAEARDAAGNVSSPQISTTVSNTLADTIAPTAVITSPTTGASAGNTFTTTASANDNVGVARVELWVDGALKLTDTTAPYSFSVNSRKWAVGSNHTLVSKAFDAAGNMGASASVSVRK